MFNESALTTLVALRHSKLGKNYFLPQTILVNGLMSSNGNKVGTGGNDWYLETYDFVAIPVSQVNVPSYLNKSTELMNLYSGTRTM